MTIEISKTQIPLSQKALFSFLENFANFEKIIPDSIEKFNLEEENIFSFILKGMPEIGLHLKNKTPNTLLSFDSANKKIDFLLDIHIFPTDDKNCEIQLNFNGKFSAMMSMMIKKPLNNFLNGLVEKMKVL